MPQGRYRDGAEHASADLSRECPVVPTPSAVFPSAAPTAQPAPPPVANVQSPSSGNAENPAPARAEAPVAPTASYWTPPRVIGWSAISAGVLAGAGALYFTGAALAERRDYKRTVDAEAAKPGSIDPSLQDKQHRDDLTARVLAVAGGALVAGGATVLLFGSKGGAQPRATAQVQALPGWLGASFCQRF